MNQFSSFKTHLFDLIDNSAFEILELFNIPVLFTLMKQSSIVIQYKQ